MFFIFIGKDKKLIKLLHDEDVGLVMYVKCLETGRFKLPYYEKAFKSYPMEWRDLVLMVEGIQADMRIKMVKSIKGQRIQL